MPPLGPDATGVGWVYQYAVIGANRTLAELRTLQDWYMRYQLTKAQGVAEVASVGGFVQQYQVVVDPVKLHAYGVSLMDVPTSSGTATGTSAGAWSKCPSASTWCAVQGYLRGKDDIANLVVKAERGLPVLFRNIAHVELGPDERRGVTDLNGEGEVVSGIAVARYGQNALEVIQNVKERSPRSPAGLPQGVTIKAVYDRSDLIYRAIENLRNTLIEEALIVALVCMIFLLHFRSALVAIVMLPVGRADRLYCDATLGHELQHHEPGRYRHRDRRDGRRGHRHDRERPQASGTTRRARDPFEERAAAMIEACKEVGPALFFSAADHHRRFVPVFTLESQEGRMFSPLAYTKTFSMAGAALLAITLVPVLMLLFIRGRILPEDQNPVNRFLIWVYHPIIEPVMRRKQLTIVVALLSLALTYPASRLGSEFMPTLNEGTLLYMPSSLPGMSVTKAAELMQSQDKIIKSFPEVESVFGKAGRAKTATDPAPLEMFETVINLKPQSEWREGMTVDKLIAELDQALQFPGVSNSWTMPIKARIDMLATGIRTPIGIKVFGKSLEGIEEVARQVEAGV